MTIDARPGTSPPEPQLHRLQSLVFPNFDVCSEEALYLRLAPFAFFDLKRRRLDFMAGGLVSSDTFYNGVTVGVWKRRCDIRTLVLRLEGEGAFVVSFGIHRRGQASTWVGEERVELVDGRAGDVAVAAWPRLDDGLLFFRLRAVGAGVVTGGGFLTPDAPPNEVRLGLVITHFNRQAQVLPAIERIRAGVLTRPDLADRITLTVVDNSRNLPLPVSQPGIECIPNRNFGGTGGFVRGLLSLVDGGRHTHALFMDDDASCETESIVRTHALLSHARDRRLAVAGALLRELAPWQLFEKGARFDGQVRPLGAGLDMRNVGDLLAAESLPESPDYGAWWFFAFPLAEVRKMPFPFFVRGDDIQFGLANRFRIATLNGVACFGEDFHAKHSPLTAYLDARYHLVLALMGDGGRASGGATTRLVVARLTWIARRLFVKSLTAYQYSSARAVTLALRHVAQGPGFFADHLDLHAVRAEIAGWPANEKLQPLGEGAAAAPSHDWRGPRRSRESAGRRLVRLLTLQGFLLPGHLLRDRATVLDKSFHGSAGQVFRYRRVIYRHAPTDTGYLAVYDRPRFFAELGDFLRSAAALLRRLPALQRAYADAADTMTTVGFWRRVYGIGGTGGAEASAPASAGDGSAAVAAADAEAATTAAGTPGG